MFKRLTLLIPALVLVAGGWLAGPSLGGPPVVFSDDTFDDADWGIVDLFSERGGSAVAEQNTTDGLGNPSPYRRMLHALPASPEGPSSINVRYRYLGGSYDPSVNGPIDHIEMSMDRRIFSITGPSGEPLSGAVGHLFMLYQGGSSYAVLLDVAQFNNFTWETVALFDLDSDAFDNGGGTHPDFSSSGSPISFGYLRSNTNNAGGFAEIDINISHGIDNYLVTVFPVANQGPVANAGADLMVHPGTVVTLDGSASSDPDGNVPLTYIWQFLSKPAESEVELSDPAALMPTFTPDVHGDYVIELVVTDTIGAASAPDEVVVSTFNTAPVADAGPDQAIMTIGTVVQLDGGQSFDDEGDVFTYAWTVESRPASSSATLDDTSIVDPTLVADVHGAYVISLVVTDVFGAASAADSVTISFDNVAPVAHAGNNQSVLVGDLVLLDGTDSSDANLDSLTFDWVLTSTPSGSAAVLDDHTSALPAFSADLAGMYVLTLVANDGFVDSDPSNVTIVALSMQDVFTETLEEALDVVNGLDAASLKNPKRRKALTKKINVALEKIEQGEYAEAYDKLVHDILKKTDGCAEDGEPDANDWIIDCAAQGELYPLLVEAIDLLQFLI